eukprot:m.263528 g.263528  ORF g.263528 m.263528 type:complete len:758 (-) comp27011_c0_seq1:28-2301(-)
MSVQLKRASSSTALLRAVSRGDLRTVSRIFERRGRPVLAAASPDGCCPIHLAAKRGNMEVVKYLLDNGASVTDRDQDPKRQGTVLMYASWGGHLALVRYLIDECGASMDDKDVVGNSPLLYGVYGGHKHVVLEYVQRGRSLRERNNKNHSAILQAACGGHLELCEWLIQQGFSLAETDSDGNSSLLFASWGGHLSLINFLLQHGSSLDEKNHNGHSVFLSAANGGRVEVVEWLMAQGFDIQETNNNGDTALLLACYGGHVPLVKRLLELGADLSDKNACGFTPLLSAANGGQLEMADWLIKRGCSLKESDNDGYTALILSACGGSIELVEFFLANGASLSERNNNGDSALLLAAYCGHKDLVQWLLEHGSNIQEKNSTGMGVLISAANGGHFEVVQYLLEFLKGEHLEETDEGGYTPLLLAAQRGHFDVVQYLAAHGANVQARTTRHDNDAIALAVDFPDLQEYLRYIYDMTPLQVACDARMVDRVHQLLVAGVDPTVHPKPSLPLLQLASSTGKYKGAPAPCRETLMLIKHSQRPWSPYTNSLFSPRFRTTVFTVMLVQERLACMETLPILPPEVWLIIGSFFQRSWFATPSDRPKWLGQIAAKDRRSWRRLRLLREPEELETEVETEIEEEEDDEYIEAELDLTKPGCTSVGATGTTTTTSAESSEEDVFDTSCSCSHSRSCSPTCTLSSSSTATDCPSPLSAFKHLKGTDLLAGSTQGHPPGSMEVLDEDSGDQGFPFNKDHGVISFPYRVTWV